MGYKVRLLDPKAAKQDRLAVKGHATTPRRPDGFEANASREDYTPLEAAVKAKRRQRGKVARAARKANR